ncbi:MAG: 3-phosphoshikimate 1-carboxyvinyltransferase [Gemmatimonadota bacterium]|nr:3-phosphoshikimate 1-carboxyvinyltransferase [Gemmatimonadota bacterium]
MAAVDGRTARRFRVGGEVRVPGDKSISHRALILAALASGTSAIRDLLDSADVRSTAGALGALGVDIALAGTDMIVAGRGLRGLNAPVVALDCGNSGTTTRLLAGVVAGHPFAARFEGDASLSRRPMDRIARPLRAMGATVELAGERHLPMTVHGGGLRSIEWESEVASAQIKSAVLLAGLVGGVRVAVTEPAASRDHSERMLRARGVKVATQGATVRLDPPDRLSPLDITVPGDPSSAAFFVALAALAAEGDLLLRDVALNETRTGFLLAVRAMAGRQCVEVERGVEQGGEPVGSIRVRPATLHAIDVSAAEVPAMIDELPMLACLATRAEGTTTIAGAAELRVKESDRIAALVSNLRILGADTQELPDGLAVTGSDRPLRGRVTTHGDHRIAMAFGVLAALPGNDIAIDDPACVAVSYPGFWNELRRVVIT